MKNSFNRLYIHIPFCGSKCGYCAFYSEPSQNKAQIDQYIQKLAEQFISTASSCGDIETIFLGGGTPTLLSATQLETLFSLIHKHITIKNGAEISIECNPETLNIDKMAVIEQFCNRISLGVQSFNPSLRKTLQRQGNESAVYDAVALVRNSAIKNMGVDLICGIPGQTVENWRDDVTKAAELGISHLSAYALTIEEGTALATQDINEEELNDISVDMWELTEHILSTYGLFRYEISNYAKPGFECRHNLEIWYGDTYLGLGPAASSFDGDTRWTQVANLQCWLNGVAAEYDYIDAEARAREIFVMGLRTVKGWQADKFRFRTGFSWDLWQPKVDGLINCGLLEYTENRLYPTQKGLLFWDEIGMELI